jgi:hypothetical protein
LPGQPSVRLCKGVSAGPPTPYSPDVAILNNAVAFAARAFAAAATDDPDARAFAAAAGEMTTNSSAILCAGGLMLNKRLHRPASAPRLRLGVKNPAEPG